MRLSLYPASYVKKCGGAGSTSNDGKMHPEPAGRMLN